ncbi:hypothetical protein J6590_106944, partial [Homalodisca vitripennis]
MSGMPFEVGSLQLGSLTTKYIGDRISELREHKYNNESGSAARKGSILVFTSTTATLSLILSLPVEECFFDRKSQGGGHI